MLKPQFHIVFFVRFVLNIRDMNTAGEKYSKLYVHLSIFRKRLRWFGHVKRMPLNRLPLKILEWEPEGTRRRGRPKERWIDGVRRSMKNHGLTEEDTRDRDRWRNLVLGEGKPL
jgi:hypothetical protein